MNILFKCNDTINHVLSYCDNTDKHNLYIAVKESREITKDNRYSFNIRLAIKLMNFDYIDMYVKDSNDIYFIYKYLNQVLKTQNPDFVTNVFRRYPNDEYLNSRDFIHTLVVKMDDWEKVIFGLIKLRIIVDLENIICYYNEFIGSHNFYGVYYLFTSSDLLLLLLKNDNFIKEIKIEHLRHAFLVSNVEYIEALTLSRKSKISVEQNNRLNGFSFKNNSLDFIKWRVKNKYYDRNILLNYCVLNNCIDEFYPNTTCYMIMKNGDHIEIYPDKNRISDITNSLEMFPYDPVAILNLAKNNNFETAKFNIKYTNYFNISMILCALKYERYDIVKDFLIDRPKSIEYGYWLFELCEKTNDEELIRYTKEINNPKERLWDTDIYHIIHMNLVPCFKYLFGDYNITLDDLMVLCDNNNIEFVKNLVLSSNIRTPSIYNIDDSINYKKVELLKKSIKRIFSEKKYICLIECTISIIMKLFGSNHKFLFYVIKYLSVDALKTMSLDVLLQLHCTNDDPNTGFNKALKYGNLEKVEYLLSIGFSPNNYSLYYAFINNKDTAIWLLNDIFNKNKLLKPNLIRKEIDIIQQYSKSVIQSNILCDVCKPNFIKWVNEIANTL